MPRIAILNALLVAWWFATMSIEGYVAFAVVAREQAVLPLEYWCPRSHIPLRHDLWRRLFLCF